MMKHKNLAIIFLCTVPLISQSCSLFRSSQTPQGYSNSIWVEADQGGTLQLQNGATLEIAPHSLPEDSEISLAQISETVQDADYFAPAGDLYEVSLGPSVVNPPATLTLPYDSTLLPSDVPPETLFLAYYDEATSSWVYAGGEVDTNRQVVSVQTSHASRWSVFHWNWDAWIAFLSKTLEGSVVSWIEAVDLLTNDCPQAGDAVWVNDDDSRNMIQGCIETDDPVYPRLRVVNPKAFYYEIHPLSEQTVTGITGMLAPGESVEFSIDLRYPSPLVVVAAITREAGYRLVVHLVLSMLPGFNVFEGQPQLLACITERVKDISEIVSATEDLLDGNGAAASEHLITFLRDGDAVRRFIGAADDCGVGVAKTWDWQKVSLIANLANVIFSSVNYVANTVGLFISGDTATEVAFIWNLQATATPVYTLTPTQDSLAPLNTRDPQSILDWVQYAIENRDLTIFQQLVGGKDILYVVYIEGGQTISADYFLNDLEERISSQPVCQGVYLDDSFLQVWYSNWSPAWEMTETCYSDYCKQFAPPYQSGTAAFMFRNVGGEYQLEFVHLSTPWAYYYSFNNLPIVACIQGVENFATATPSPSCPGAPPQRLQVGGRGQVCTRTDNVRLRIEPGSTSNIVASLPTGTVFTVIGGPECAGDNWSWWQIRTIDGLTGWIAEGGDETDRYFLCPLP